MTDRLDEPPGGEAGSLPTEHRRLSERIGRGKAFLAGVLACALVVVLAVAVLRAAEGGAQALTESDVRVTVERALASQTPGPAYSALVYAAIAPSIVLVQADYPAADRPSATHGLGSGVVVDASGTVLTALHVVEGASHVSLTFADGSTSDATVVVERPEMDIAVLQPDAPPAGIVPATLGNARALRIGSEAYIVGNPFGLTWSMSAGVISGLDRTFEVPRSGRVLRGLIQVDAAVNPGNSGGPLLDRGGNVTGIVTALVNPTQEEVFVGIGLAVPIDAAAGAAGLPPY